MNIRDEYKKHKKQNDEIITEAAMNWLDRNVVVISEKIDRKSVHKFVRNVEKFENKFGPYASKLPTIANVLAGAESNLNDVLTGKVSDKRISDTMEYISYAYNTLSDFFAKDLPLLLRTKTFSLPKENPEVRLDALSGAGFDANNARKVFATAIVPSKEEMKLIGRIIKKNHIPNIDSKQISNELLSLTYQELADLTNIDKVPLVVSEQDVKKKLQAKLINERLQLINEAKDGEVLKSIGTTLNSIKNIARSNGLNRTSAAVSNLYSSFIETYKSSLENNKSLSGVLGLSSPEQKKLIKQANQALEIFTKIGETYNEVKPLLADDQPTPEDLNNIQQIILKKVSKTDGITGFLKSFTKVKPFDGLDADSILNELFEVAGLTQAEGQEPAATPDGSTNDVALEKLQGLNNILSQLSQVADEMKSVNTQSTEGTPGTTPGSQTDGTQGTASSDQTTGTGSNKTQSGDEASEVAKKISDAGNFGSSEKNIQQVKQVLQAVQRAGYQITKK